MSEANPPLPSTVTNSRLWKLSLGRTDAAKLTQPFLNMRNRVSSLVGEIHVQMREYTVHDITHLDALWEIADLLAGEDFHITPAEGFVLGGAILLHDAGMTLAAYPGGWEEIKNTDKWRDLETAQMRKDAGRGSSQSRSNHPSLEPADEAAALAEFLREQHASQAEKLATVSWSHKGTTHYLLEDSHLRHHYGTLIGKLAHSHWWPVSRLREEWPNPAGALGNFPAEWTVDAIKIAVLLRCADAAHLDDRRAPRFLAALRGIRGYSDQHWEFQSRLLKPQIDHERLKLTSINSFSLDERKAWWRCYEAARMVDGELRRCNDLLTTLDKPSLTAQAVAGAEDPKHFARYVKPQGWEPVETRVRVSDVRSLVERLGGKALYGNDPLVPLRELIQNAIDAVQARRMIQEKPSKWGSITVRSGRDEYGPWVEVEDTGIGMSDEVLTGPLLDFGSSYWTSPLVRQEHPGLLSRGFESIGKFGIGFFSVFMWGSRVRVLTRKLRDGSKETRALEFDTGLDTDPILRSVGREEELENEGTCVRVWLTTAIPPITNDKKTSVNYRFSNWPLSRLISWLCPASPVDIHVSTNGQSEPSVHANDWHAMDPIELLARIHGSALPEEARRELTPSTISKAMKLLKDENGQIYGRAFLCPEPGNHGIPDWISRGVVVISGLRAGGLVGIGGIFLGTSHTANRFLAWPTAPKEVLAEWASTQAKIWDERIPHDDETGARQRLSRIVAACGGQLHKLPIAIVDGKTMDEDSFDIWARTVPAGEKVNVISSHAWEEEKSENYEVGHNVFTGATSYLYLLAGPPTGWISERISWPWTHNLENEFFDGPLELLVLQKLASSWRSTTDALNLVPFPNLLNDSRRGHINYSVTRP